MLHFTRILPLCLAIILGLLHDGSAQAKNPLIAAASSLRTVMAELEEEFMNTGGSKLRLSFGSSGNLARQIAQGGPYEMFMSADEAYVTPLVKAALTRGPGTQYAQGRLALIARKNSSFTPTANLKALRAAFSDKTLKHFAIANPEHAPYGRAAKQVLIHAQLWQDLQPFLIFGENVAQTTQFAISSSTKAGLVSYSLALAPAVAKNTRHVVIPAEWHQPLKHHMVLLKTASPEAMKFYTFMTTPKAQVILTRHGFSPASIK